MEPAHSAPKPLILGDTARLRAATGWTPRIPLPETVRAVFEHEMAA